MKTIPIAAATQVTRATCPYCGTGCGVLIESRGDQIVQVQGDPDHPANFGRLCTKGSTLHLTAAEAVTQQTRLLYPMRRAGAGTSNEASNKPRVLNGAVSRGRRSTFIGARPADSACCGSRSFSAFCRAVRAAASATSRTASRRRWFGAATT